MSTRPTAEELAKQALLVLDRQKAFFKERPGSEQKAAALALSKSAEAQLRKMADSILSPSLFD
jgi:hypothetical protein